MVPGSKVLRPRRNRRSFSDPREEEEEEEEEEDGDDDVHEEEEEIQGKINKRRTMDVTRL